MRIFYAAVSTVLYLALSQIGFAADLPIKAPPVYKAPVATWTGCYVGGNVGYGWAPTEWTATTTGIQFASQKATGFVAGGQVGCDYQINQQWVIGFRGLFDDGLKGSSTLNAALTETVKVPWFATAVGRIGYLVAPNTLLFAQGGAAWARNELNECCAPVPAGGGFGGGGVVDTFFVLVFADGSANATRSGWTIGSGIEHRFTPNISGFIEYDYVRLGANDIAFTGMNGWPNFSYEIHQNINLVLTGLNFRFNSWR
jgi:outer membrane immunogenic protein